MAAALDQLPEDVEALKAALIEVRAKLSGAEAMLEHLQLVIAKMKREAFGPRSERSQRLIDQMELQLEELAAAAGEDATRAETTGVQVQGFTRSKGRRRNFPDHLPRRRVVHPGPTSCPCCGGTEPLCLWVFVCGHPLTLSNRIRINIQGRCAPSPFRRSRTAQSSAFAAIAAHTKTANIQFFYGRQQFKRKGTLDGNAPSRRKMTKGDPWARVKIGGNLYTSL
jgi:Transposase C of IS166 homeodomain